jgi:type I restriction enzyme M protein
MGNYIEVRTVAAFVEAIATLGPGIYRGQVENSPLLPSIGRQNMQVARKRNPLLEKNLLEQFRFNAAGFLPALGDTTTAGWWRCMVLAQHHGLPTRLLDWTRSPLAALFFATERPPESDESVVYVLLPSPEVHTADWFERRWPCPPWDYGEEALLFLQPEVTHPRISAQGSLFSVHPGSPVDRLGSEVYERDLRRIVVPKDASTRIATGLYRLGITKALLFPGPDGVAATLRWAAAGEVDHLSDQVLESGSATRLNGPADAGPNEDG